MMIEYDQSEPIESFLSSLQEKWWNGETGVRWKGKRVIKIELHTWGWSENETIIDELKKTIFWFYWTKSERGGHYYFEVRR